MAEVIRMIQISDIHLFGNQEKLLLGVKTQESFQATINSLKKKINKIDLMVLSGDLSQDGSIMAYEYLADELKSFGIPIYWIAGNHDDMDMMKQVYPRESMTNQKQIILKKWQIILLNSQKPKAVEGYLTASELQYLRQCLHSYPNHHTIIFFHHHPVSVGCGWLEPIGLQNATEFWEMIAPYPQIKGVFFGHVHQEFAQTIGNIPCYSAPSTCFQFKPKQVSFALEKIPPGYRWIELHANGCLKTAVERAPQYIGTFDVNAKGY